VDSLLGATSMKIVMDSVNEITPELLSRTRTSRAVNGRAADPAASRVRERNLVLRQTCRVEGHTPVCMEKSEISPRLYLGMSV
jgi:hypothetical protein